MISEVSDSSLNVLTQTAGLIVKSKMPIDGSTQVLNSLTSPELTALVPVPNATLDLMDQLVEEKDAASSAAAIMQTVSDKMIEAKDIGLSMSDEDATVHWTEVSAELDELQMNLNELTALSGGTVSSQKVHNKLNSAIDSAKDALSNAIANGVDSAEDILQRGINVVDSAQSQAEEWSAELGRAVVNTYKVAMAYISAPKLVVYQPYGTGYGNTFDQSVGILNHLSNAAHSTGLNRLSDFQG